MSIIEIAGIGVGLSMDAFAVSIVKGLEMRKVRISQLLLLALAFGGFQALMPLIGWSLGSIFASRFAAVDHWIAFILLALIGGNMIRESLEPEENETKDQSAAANAASEQFNSSLTSKSNAASEQNDSDQSMASNATSQKNLSLIEVILLAIATSIDALAAGVTFSFLAINIIQAIAIIGCITFCFTIVGVYVGHLTGDMFKSKAELLGGVILILLGLRILISHLFLN